MPLSPGEARNSGGAAEGYGAFCIRTCIARRCSGVRAGKTCTGCCIEVKLGLKIFQIEGEVQNVCIGIGGATGAVGTGDVVTGEVVPLLPQPVIAAVAATGTELSRSVAVG
jgi:hypothetical protein